MEPLNGDSHAPIWECESNREFGDPSRLHAVGSKDLGGILVLDYNTMPEPRVLWLWMDLGGELREEEEGTSSKCWKAGATRTRTPTQTSRDRREAALCRAGSLFADP
jgi:hypothetical protein